MKNLRIAMVQNAAGGNMAGNIGRVLPRVIKAARGADLVALPEVFAMRGTDEDYRLSAEPLDGPLVQRFAGVARGKRVWILLGSVIEKAGRNIYNTCVLLDRRGSIAATYRKMHLFEARLDDGRIIREADTYTAGRKPVLVDIEGWRAGLAMCYDLRFPELFRRYSAGGAHVFFVPSNFTQRTGKDHWEVLVRVRAIENQCFVVAPNQCGTNKAIGVKSYGHSMMVGPWGEVLAEAGDRETVVTVELDADMITRTRRRIPALKHRVM